MPHLHERLALFDYVTSLLGGDADAIGAALRDTDEGEGPDGHSHFYAVLSARNGRLRLGDGELERYDAHVLAHERTIRRYRPGFHFRYFQYLAALYTEVVLDRLARDPAQLLLDVEAHREQHFPDLLAHTAGTLRTLAFWMATGAGKTLLMHVNLLQAFDYFPDRFQNVLLLVPTETLRDQHLVELRKSGLDAAFALDAEATRARVQVLEITKLYVEGETAKPRGKGAVSMPTSEFEGPNLLLVDEGHKGTRTKSDEKTERQWRAIRDDLAGTGGPAAQTGLTFEYSATFAQVTDNDDGLFNDYARQTLFEYAYRRFHGDGFGKDYHVVNVKQEPELYGDTLLLGGLLTFYEKQRVFDEMPEAADLFNEAPPLMVFVSSRVTGGSELVDVLEFLDRVLREDAWARDGIDKLLQTPCQSGLPGPDGRDAFEHSFPYLKSLGLAPADLYSDLCHRLFYGVGPLVLVPLADAPGEIGLRTADAAKDRFFGVINVGDASALAKKVEKDTGIAVSGQTPFTGSLFDTVGDDTSPLRFLVGAKKFTEGWSTPRVSVMGLMKVGASAGAQVLQLFGRGVRLRGVGGLMRRADTVPGTQPPPHLDRLETLDLFGVKANYLNAFLEMLKREGAEIPVLRTLPLFADEQALQQAGLITLRVEEGYDFASAETIVFDPASFRTVTLDLMPKMVTGDAEGTVTASTGLTPQPIPEDAQTLLDLDALYYHALAHKRKKGWHNLQVSREAVRRALGEKARLAAPAEVLAPSTPAHFRALNAAARTLVEKALDAFYRSESERAEKGHLFAYPLDVDDLNFPTLTVRERGGSRYIRAYELKVPESMLEEVDALLADAEALREEANGFPLPRMHVSAHLYTPLLVEGKFDLGAGRFNVQKPTTGKRVRSTPAGLVESEVRFLHDLRIFWKSRDRAAWGEAQLFVLRNLPRAGVGFFGAAGFYPDFLIWLKEGEQQALAFVDPKGLSRWNEDKVALLETIRSLSDRAGFPLFGFIVTPTAAEDLSIPGVAPEDVQAVLAERGVLLQDRGDYVEDVLSPLRQAVRECGADNTAASRPAPADVG